MSSTKFFSECDSIIDTIKSSKIAQLKSESITKSIDIIKQIFIKNFNELNKTNFNLNSNNTSNNVLITEDNSLNGTHNDNEVIDNNTQNILNDEDEVETNSVEKRLDRIEKIIDNFIIRENQNNKHVFKKFPKTNRSKTFVNNQNYQRYKTNKNCFNCGKTGHLIRNCYFNRNVDRKTNFVQNSRNDYNYDYNKYSSQNSNPQYYQRNGNQKYFLSIPNQTTGPPIQLLQPGYQMNGISGQSYPQLFPQMI